MNNTSLVISRLNDEIANHIKILSERATILSLIDPSNPEHVSRIRGIIEGLFIGGIIPESTRNTLVRLTYGDSELGYQRLGRDRAYVVQITTEQGRSFDFEVAAINPSDAYFQLTKRSSYKSITDIMQAVVYEGTGLSTSYGDPLKTFQKDELVFNSLAK